MKVMLYEKIKKYKNEVGEEKKFPIKLVKLNDKKTLETNLSKECEKSLIIQLAKKDLKLPVIIEPTDYFIKTERIKGKDGNVYIKKKLVLLELEVLEKAEFEKQTLEDIVNELEKEATNMQEKTTEDDMPF